MRFPHVINDNTKEAYAPSSLAVNLKAEEGRKVISENLKWGDDYIPSLSTLCIKIVSKYFKKIPAIDKLYGADRDQLLEILSTSLPLQLVVPLIHNEIYWKRKYKDEFGILMQRKYFGWTWKQMYLQRYTKKMCEEADPQSQQEDSFSILTKIFCPYVKKLLLTQLQMWKPPLNLLPEEIPEYWSLDHINFIPILKKLTEIEEFSIVMGMDNVKDKFVWNMFKFTVLDCSRIGSAVLSLPHIKILRFHRCKMEDDHCQALIQRLLLNKTLTELDLSHCAIQDHGTKCIAKLMTVHPRLEILKLNDNKIGSKGTEAIGWALLEPTCCPIVRLDLRTNPLNHAGAMGILRALVRGTGLKELSLGSCRIDNETVLRIAQMLSLNSTIEILDLSNNWCGEDGGELLIHCLTTNRSIKWLDLRATNITEAQHTLIRRILKRNQLNLDEIPDEEIDEVEEDIIEFDDVEEETEEEEEAEDD
ncbi:hypothetical protein FQA39_LY02813 [Lamprigera yunnana]|nr:hypothetical protein FQA39_LY02813 [Lamprigera yunnana]